ncbi:MAG: 50S ribosomal protein L11 methyltransferase, partial [Clostridia bacterium]|nr:50S ribosomal protein L11 methyltransferase [Clostridia bacterium]
MSPDIGNYLKQGSYLFTSGIIEGYAEDVRKAMKSHGFTLVEEAMESDWVAMVYQKD